MPDCATHRGAALEPMPCFSLSTVCNPNPDRYKNPNPNPLPVCNPNPVRNPNPGRYQNITRNVTVTTTTTTTTTVRTPANPGSAAAGGRRDGLDTYKGVFVPLWLALATTPTRNPSYSHNPSLAIVITLLMTLIISVSRSQDILL